MSCRQERPPIPDAIGQQLLQEYPENHSVHYLITEKDVDQALEFIQNGVIGFDTEYMPRKSTALHDFLDNLFSNVAGSKKTAIWELHAMELASGVDYAVRWDEIGLCVI